MIVTLDLLESLLARGWSIRGRSVAGKTQYEYRNQHGSSGWDYQSDSFVEFPPAVEEWIWVNVPLVELQP